MSVTVTEAWVQLSLPISTRGVGYGYSDASFFFHLKKCPNIALKKIRYEIDYPQHVYRTLYARALPTAASER